MGANISVSFALGGFAVFAIIASVASHIANGLGF